MNSPVDPLPDDVVDELLSADLDGDFDLATATTASRRQPRVR